MIGLSGACKECQSRRDRERYAGNQILGRKKAKEKYAANRDKITARNRKRYAAHPERHRAKKLVRQALATGELTKGKCEVHDDGCTGGRIEGHHEDYSKPLEVRWMCASSHKQLHVKERREAANETKESVAAMDGNTENAKQPAWVITWEADDGIGWRDQRVVFIDRDKLVEWAKCLAGDDIRNISDPIPLYTQDPAAVRAAALEEARELVLSRLDRPPHPDGVSLLMLAGQLLRMAKNPEPTEAPETKGRE